DINGGAGSFYLPMTLESGEYIVRAYTNWMKNFGAQNFYEKSITIVNTMKSPGITAENSPKVTVAVFPEGGNLVAGLSSRVAFKVSNQSGKQPDLSGYVVSSKGDTVTRI